MESLSATVREALFASRAWPQVFADAGVAVCHDPRARDTLAVHGLCAWDAPTPGAATDVLRRFLEFRCGAAGTACDATCLEAFPQASASRALAVVRKRHAAPLVAQLGFAEVDVLTAAKAHIDGTVSVFAAEAPRARASALPRPRLVASWHVLRALPPRSSTSSSSSSNNSSSTVLCHYGFVLQFPAADFAAMTEPACVVLATLLLLHQSTATAGTSVARAAARLRQHPPPQLRSLVPQRIASDSLLLLPIVSALVDAECRRRRRQYGSSSSTATTIKTEQQQGQEQQQEEQEQEQPTAIAPLDYAHLAVTYEGRAEPLFPPWAAPARLRPLDAVPSQTAGVLLAQLDAERYCRALLFVTAVEPARPLGLAVLAPAAVQHVCVAALDARRAAPAGTAASVALFDYLPDRLVLRVLAALDNATLLRLAATCRRMHTLVYHHVLARAASPSTPSPCSQPLLVATAEPNSPTSAPAAASTAVETMTLPSEPFPPFMTVPEQQQQQQQQQERKQPKLETAMGRGETPRRPPSYGEFVRANAARLDENWARGACRVTTLANGHTSSVRALALHSASGALFSGASDRKVKLWALRSPRAGGPPCAGVGTLTGPNAGVVTIRLDAEAEAGDAGGAPAVLTVGFRNGVVKTWESAAAGSGEWKVRGERQLAAIAEGFVFGGAATLLWDDSVCALDSETGAVLGAFTAHTKKVTCADFLPGTRGTVALSSSLDKTMRVWDTRTGVGASTGPASTASTSATSSTSSASSSAVILRGHTAGVNSFALLSDSVLASAANDRSVRLWDLRHPAAPLATLHGHVSPVRCVVCDRRRRVLLSGSDDHSVRLWSAQTFSPLCRYEEHAAPVTCLAADDVFLVSASSDGAVCVSDFAADIL